MPSSPHSPHTASAGDAPPGVPIESLAATLQQATALHRMGQHQAAMDLYAQILERDPDHPQALLLSGLLALQLGQPALAAARMRQVLAQMPAHASAHGHLGLALKQMGQHEEALASLDRALALRPDDASVLNNRGNLLVDLHRHTEAVDCFEQALRHRPADANTHHNLGIALLALARHDQALAHLAQACALNPRHAQAWIHRGNALKGLSRPDEALRSYERAIDLGTDQGLAWRNHGVVLMALKRWEEAHQSMLQALTFMPEDLETIHHLAQILLRLDRQQDALRYIEQAIARQPDDPDAHNNRGIAHMALQELTLALSSFDRAIALDPGHARAHWNRSLVCLLGGDFERGWPDYEWGWTCGMRGQQRTFAQPLWLGQCSLEGRTLLVHAEQGLGDTLQFYRYVQTLHQMGAQVVLEVQYPLTTLLQQQPWPLVLIERGQALPATDFHCPMLSLPLALKTRLDSIPQTTPYLWAPQDKAQQWRHALGPDFAPRVGLVWRGSPSHQNDHQRSLALAKWLPHLPSGFRYISLQKEVHAEDRPALDASALIHMGHRLADFSDTAALCDGLDLIVGVDTSVVHLAAGMGKPTWVLLPHVPDWRWLLERQDSPWYPSVRLYRQGSDRSWDAVLRQVAMDLERLRDQAVASGERTWRRADADERGL